MQIISANFGLKLKELRKQRGLTQKQICEGVCEQPLISKIEKGQTYPSMNITFGLLKRLGIDMEYFYNITIDTNIKEKMELKNILKRAIRNRDFDKIENIVQSVGEEIFKNDIQFEQMRLWRDAFKLFYVDNDYRTALIYLNNAFNIISSKKKVYTELELEILNAESEIHYDQGKYTTSESVARKALEYFESMINISDGKIKIRILYNLIKALTELNKNNEALDYCRIAEKEIFNNHLMYLLGEVYHYTAINLRVIGEKEDSNKYSKKSRSIFDIKNI